MGNSSSKTSYLQYHNDFELVIRVTKDLEHMLVTKCGAPNDKTVGLHDKITFAQERFALSHHTVKQLRYLVTVRNQLVHQHDFNELPDRAYFAQSYELVEKELKQKIMERNRPQGNGDSSGGCIIS